MHILTGGHFNQSEPGWMTYTLADGGATWMVLADLPSYIVAQEQANNSYADRQWWVRAAMMNTASGKF